MNKILSLMFLLFLAACGAGGSGTGSSPSAVPVGTVSGVGFDGLLISADIKIYDFSSGSKGVLLAQGVSDYSGIYNLSMQIESRPILIEATGGYYLEEAGSGFQVQLTPNHKLTALTNYSTGSALNVSVTSFTHLATGLAAYNISKGASVVTAINAANSRISSLIGIDILATTPRQINDPANVSVALTPGLRYGFLSGAISMWTYNHTPPAAAAHKIPYTSIDFAQLMYRDISADGLLDGSGFDATGALTPLSFGSTPLGVDVYRLGLGISLLQIANDKNNKTQLDSASVLPYVQSYISGTDAMFNNVVPTAIHAPVVTVTTPAPQAVLVGSVQVSGTTSTASILKTVELLVDDIAVATAVNLATPVFTLNTSSFADGAHTIGVRATDIGGLVTTSSASVLIVNTAPSVTISGPWNYAVLTGVANVSATTQSTVGISKVDLLFDDIVVATAANLATPVFTLNTALYADGAHTIGVRVADIGGKVVTKTVPVVIANIAPSVTIAAPASAELVRGSLNVTATAQSKSGLATVALLIDDVLATAATNLAAAPFQLPLVSTNYPDGAHTIGVRATDVGGLITTHTIPVVFNNIAPAVNITSPKVSSILHGFVNVSATTQSLAGVATNALLVDGLLVATATSLTSPTFSLNSALYLDGAHTIGVRATDIGGLETTSSVQVVIDNVAPVVSLASPAANAVLNTSVSVVATIQSGAGLSLVELLVDGVSVATTASNLAAPTFQFNFTGYADGAHTIGVRATDIGGLVTTRAVSVIFDNVPPAVTINTPASDAVLSKVVSVAATVQSLAGVAKVELLLDGAAIATAAIPATPSFMINTANYAEGAHVLGLRSTDVGGLVTIHTIPVTFDNLPPVVTITAPAAGVWARTSIAVTGTSSSAPGLTKTEVLVDGISVGTVVNPALPSFTLNTANYVDGAHVLGLRSTDVGGFVTTNTIPVNFDNTPPTSPWVKGGQGTFPSSPTTYVIVVAPMDNFSGVATVTVPATGQVTGSYPNNSWCPYAGCRWVNIGNATPGVSHVIRISDVAGNCSDYTVAGGLDVSNATGVLTTSGSCP